jgi:leader peptidase (prepilin peptidase) / N-methyltransferase
MNQRLSCKTFDRTRRFVVEGLNWRGAARPYALVVWGLLAGLIWIGLDLMLASAVTASVLLLKLSLLTILTVLAAIDARFGIIPDRLSLVLLISGAVSVLVENSQGMLTTPSSEVPVWLSGLEPIFWRAIEALITVLGAISLRLGYRLLRGREGFGFGDVKFVGAAALWVGLSGLPLMLMIAVGSALATILLLRQQVRELNGADAVPFGPHLALGLWLSFLLGADIGS